MRIVFLGPSGQRQGNPGEAPGGAAGGSRHLDRRHAAGGRARGDAARPAGAGHHGGGGARVGRPHDRPDPGADRRSPTPAAGSSSTGSRARSSRRRPSDGLLERKWQTALDAVVNFSVPEGDADRADARAGGAGGARRRPPRDGPRSGCGSTGRRPSRWSSFYRERGLARRTWTASGTVAEVAGRIDRGARAGGQARRGPA